MAQLVIHGGAGAPSRAYLTPALEAEMRATLSKILLDGGAQLAAGASALDVATEAVRALEDCPHLNAGRGAVLNAAGEHELDAAVMCGSSGRAGAVCCVRTILNPILTARALLESGAHVMLAGAGAEAFSQRCGHAAVENSVFATPYRRQQWEAARGAAAAAPPAALLGTVGAVCLDAHGALAAATSTGGMTNKLPGRVGDTPCLGAGTFADAGVAVSCTGTGEAFMRACAAKEVASVLKWRQRAEAEAPGEGLRVACAEALRSVAALGGSGGLIAVASDGSVELPFDTEGMYRGTWSAAHGARVAIYSEALSCVERERECANKH